MDREIIHKVVSACGIMEYSINSSYFSFQAVNKGKFTIRCTLGMSSQTIKVYNEGKEIKDLRQSVRLSLRGMSIYKAFIVENFISGLRYLNSIGYTWG